MVAKATATVSATKQTPKDLAVNGGGSGEMTIDLGHIMPAKGNLIYGSEMSGPDGAGWKKLTMKMRTDLRIESK